MTQGQTASPRKAVIRDMLAGRFGGVDLLGYSESGNALHLKLSKGMTDPQTSRLRSGAPILNDLAISHRLSVLLGRQKLGIPETYSLAIRSMDGIVRGTKPQARSDVSVEFRVLAERHGKTTELGSTVVAKQGAASSRVDTVFSVVSPSLMNFVRRTRGFSDYADVEIERHRSILRAVGHDRFEFFPSESDRISEGERKDHVPALTLIDVAQRTMGGNGTCSRPSRISARFLKYTDPRSRFELIRDADDGRCRTLRFVQDEETVAIVSSYPGSADRQNNSNLGEDLP